MTTANSNSAAVSAVRVRSHTSSLSISAEVTQRMHNTCEKIYGLKPVGRNEVGKYEAIAI